MPCPNGPRPHMPAQRPPPLPSFLRPDQVHIMQAGQIVKSGGWELVQALEKEGYAALGR